MKTFLKVVAVVVVILLVLGVYIATKPATFRYTRSLSINAPASVLFEHVNDLRKFQAWNPWASVDPSQTMTWSGPPQGVGSSYTWSGNDQVGEGTMTIIESVAPELVRARMEFRKPFEATNTVEFTFVPDGNGTLVSWSMYGPNSFMGKAMGTFIDVGKMTGDQFSIGLQKLKTLVESAPAALPAGV